MKTIVISPTFNERKNIKIFIDAVLIDNPDFDLLIVDDNSPDGTSDIVAEFAESRNDIYLIMRDGKLGLGTAYILSLIHI